MKTWDSESWQFEFAQASRAHNREALHRLRRAVYRNTVEVVHQRGYDTDSGHVALELNPAICADSRFYRCEFFPVPATREYSMQVGVVRGDCLEVAHRLAKTEGEVCVLNLANRQKPGGGVLSGGLPVRTGEQRGTGP